MTAEFRKRGFPITALDQSVVFHVFAWELATGAGTRQGEVVHHFDPTPRATIRDALKRLERMGLLWCVMRLRPGRKTVTPIYHPTTAVAEVVNDTYEANMRVHVRLHDTFGRYRERVGR